MDLKKLIEDHERFPGHVLLLDANMGSAPKDLSALASSTSVAENSKLVVMVNKHTKKAKVLKARGWNATLQDQEIDL